MILDTIDRLENYSWISPYMDRVLRFINQTDLDSLEPGRIEILGNDVFVNVNRQDALTRQDARIEAHKEYIDIQIPISCNEEMGFSSAAYLGAPSVPYSTEKDVEFYPGACNTYLNVRKGMFTVFFPGEGHAPGITSNGILKLIVKIRKS